MRERGLCACGTRLTNGGTRCRTCYPRRPLAERFWAKVDQSGDCWVWTGACAPYGRIREGARGSPFLVTHRLAWELSNGPVPDGLMVLHTCDNPPCVNPDHLWLGTAKDNKADEIAKGRHAHGDRWHAAHDGRHPRLTRDQLAARGRAISAGIRRRREYLARVAA